MELLLIRHALPVRVDEMARSAGPADPHLAPAGRRSRPRRWRLAGDRAGRRDLVEPDAPGPGDGGAGRRPRSACPITVDEGLVGVRPRRAQLHPDRGAEGGRRSRAGTRCRSGRSTSSPRWWTPSSGSWPPTRPAGRGGLPRRRGQRVRRPRARHRRAAVLPARPTRRSAACWRRHGPGASSRSTRPPTCASCWSASRAGTAERTGSLQPIPAATHPLRRRLSCGAPGSRAGPCRCARRRGGRAPARRGCSS